MSSTNRNGLARHAGDFYETPTYAVDLLLAELALPPEFEGYVIDPGSGTGAIAEVVTMRFPRADVRGIEANGELVIAARKSRNDRVVFEHADFLTWQPDSPADLIVGNPPYGKRWVNGCERTDDKTAEKFVLRSLEISRPKATVAMLLRSAFLVAKARRELRSLPCDVLFLERRPSFNGSGCDSTDYAWFVWGPKRGGKWKVLHA